ncbi:MAG: glycosyl hydrolase family 28-related protein [Planctomycetota bacterium]|nr:glycosyl hydrolase family 28-related protein [Planctomycetota bacterium]
MSELFIHVRQSTTLVLFLSLVGFLHAEGTTFPDDAGHVDVTKTPYRFVGDGKTDNTAAFQRAIDDLKGKNVTLYFPNGVYLLSDRVHVGGKPHSRDRFLHIQGQSESGSIIKLKDNATGFDNAAEHGHMTLIEAELTGGDPAATAIINEVPRMFLRDIRASGYGHTVRTSEGKTIDGDIDEWYEGMAQSLFDGPKKSLRLPIEETPEIPWETDMNKWVRVDVSPDGRSLQQAIDLAAKEGKTTIYFPRELDKSKKYVVTRRCSRSLIPMLHSPSAFITGTCHSRTSSTKQRATRHVIYHANSSSTTTFPFTARV